MSATGRVPIELRESGTLLLVWDPACGQCAACRSGHRALCAIPVQPEANWDAGAHSEWNSRVRSRSLSFPLSPDLVPYLSISAAALDLVRAADLFAPAILLVGNGWSAAVTGTILAASGSGTVAIAGNAPRLQGIRSSSSSAEIRMFFEQPGGPSRADIAVALDGDLHMAAKSVRRGGYVGATDAVNQMPTPTIVAQRELEVLIPRDIVETLMAMDLSGLKGLVAADDKADKVGSPGENAASKREP